MENEIFEWCGKSYRLEVEPFPSGYKIHVYDGDNRLSTYSAEYFADSEYTRQLGYSLKDIAKEDIRRRN